MRALLKECLMLSTNDKRYIIRELQKSIRDKEKAEVLEASRGRIAAICGAMDAVAPGWRTERTMWNRAIVAHLLAREGFSCVTIGRILGKDHSTVSSYQLRIMEADGMKWRGFKDIMERIEQIKQAIS